MMLMSVFGLIMAIIFNSAFALLVMLSMTSMLAFLPILDNISSVYDAECQDGLITGKTSISYQGIRAFIERYKTRKLPHKTINKNYRLYTSKASRHVGYDSDEVLRFWSADEGHIHEMKDNVSLHANNDIVAVPEDTDSESIKADIMRTLDDTFPSDSKTSKELRRIINGNDIDPTLLAKFDSELHRLRSAIESSSSNTVSALE
jgi:hypothetical protein